MTTDHTREADILADVLDDHRPQPMPDPDLVKCLCDGTVWERPDWRRHVGAAMVAERDNDMAAEPDSYPLAAHVAAVVEVKDAEVQRLREGWDREIGMYAEVCRMRDEARAAVDVSVAAERKDAWDLGYRAGHSNAMRRMSDEPHAPTTANPYRIARSTTDGGDTDG